MSKLILALCLLFPIFAYSAEPQRINFNEYNKKINELASECTSKSMPHFNGFCLSQKYDDQTQRSITVALQLIRFERFFNKCEHSDFPNANVLLIRALNIEETKRFLEEMKPQKDALETYYNYFDYCKTKDENNLFVPLGTPFTYSYLSKRDIPTLVWTRSRRKTCRAGHTHSRWASYSLRVMKCRLIMC